MLQFFFRFGAEPDVATYMPLFHPDVVLFDDGMERPIGYDRQGFFYGRSFVSDEDLNAQALSWMAGTANVRTHRTTLEVPQTRFERDERALLTPLAMYPYRSLTLDSTQPAARPRLRSMPIVERRALKVYSQIAGATA